MTICKCIKKAVLTFALATVLLILFIQEYYKKHKISSLLNNFSKFSKIANQQPPQQSPPTTSQKPPTTPTNSQINIPQSSTNVSFQDNPYTFEERHARLSEPLEPVFRQASLSEPQYEPVYNIYPPLQHDLNRARHQSQNQNTLEINRQIIHPRRNRNLQTPEFNSTYLIHQ